MATNDKMMAPLLMICVTLVYVTLPVVESQVCSKLEFCQDVLPYNQTIYPNQFDNMNQTDAKNVYTMFQSLIRTQCSKHLELFLCFSLAPPCTLLNRYIPVCRSFCETAVTKACLDILEQTGIQKPPVFECGNLPVSGVCNKGSETSEKSSPSNTYKVTVDSTTEIDLMFLTSTGNNIQLLTIRNPDSMNTDTIHMFPNDEANMRHPIDYYLPEKFIYWSSQMKGLIYRGELQVETLKNIVPIVDFGSASLESLVVDWNLCVLFWTESVPVARLRAASLSGQGVRTIVEDLKYPRSLTVDPTEGLVFWIDRKGDEFSSYSIIESFSVVNNRRKFIFNITSDTFGGGSRPRSLTADIYDKKLFWVDAWSKSLHTIKYDGSGHKILAKDVDLLREADNLLVGGDKVIWVGKSPESLVWANKYTAQDMMKIKTFQTFVPQYVRLYGKKDEINTTSYNKEKLADHWKKLSSSESMEVPDLDVGDWDEYDDDDYDEDEDDKKQKKNGGRLNSISVNLCLLSVTLAAIFNLFEMIYMD